MRFRVGIENNVEGRTLSWALEHPVCLSYGLDGEEAITAMPKAIQEYSEWIENNNQGRSPSDPFRLLQIVRSRLLEIIPTLAGSEKVVGVDGEFWSPRKVIRRVVWHERDHIFYIHRI